ncbi:MAG: hypothetical protein JWL59_3297 [Chthoniobacteraceae bacterium]|nr:hypothetical protein [Chthoniobacteraceae bacterium]
MSEQPVVPPEPAPGPAPKIQPRGYFNQSQLEDIKLAESILQAARNARHSNALAGREITEDYLAGLESAIAMARLKIAGTGQAQSGQQPATLNASDAERDLITILQGIQSAAKQKHRMLEEEDATFATDGYLIGLPLNANRATLLQNAATLAAKAGADALPGYKTAESLADIEATIAGFKRATITQHEREQETAEDRITRDKLIKKINARRIAIQHAADALWPYTESDNAPIRRAFEIPPDRPFNG